MSFDALLIWALNGLASASGLFFIAAGLSLIFGVTRIINMAHGSLYMLGIYLAYTFATRIGGGLGFWGGIVAAALIVAAIGALIEIVLLRRIYRAPELFQLLATFALVLVINDLTLWIWGPEDLLGPRAPGLRGAVEIFGRRFPSYDLFLIAMGPAVLIILHLALAKTRFGRLVRAATQDREMVGALGINQAILFTTVFALGSFLAGLGGAMQMAREPANLLMDLSVIGDAFVVVVVGGMGSIAGAYLAAVLIAEIKSICIGIGVVHIGDFSINFSKFTLVAEFIVMAVVLIIRPHGLLGRAQGAVRATGDVEAPIRPASNAVKIVALAALVLLACAAASVQDLALHDRARNRRADRDHLRDLAAFHHGSGRHAFLRPCRLFRARRLWRSPARQVRRDADAGRDRAGALCRVGRRAAVRMVCGATVGRLSRHADARLRADRVVDRVPVGERDRRLERRRRHLADRALRYLWHLLSADAVLRGGQRAAVCAACCLRPSAMRCGPAATRRCAPRRSVSTSSACTGSALPSPAAICGIAGALFAFAKGSISPETHLGRPLDRRSRHGAARRHPDLDRPDRRRRRLHAAAGHHHAAGGILARASWRHHPVAGPGVPRRPDGLLRQICRRMEAAPMSVLAVETLCKSFGGVHAVDHVSFLDRSGRVPRA